jgi:NADH-quinone oxidoreductase subunit F
MLDKYLIQIQENIGRVPKFISQRCKGYGDCIEVCPVQAVSGIPQKRTIRIDAQKCIKCGACIESCKAKAIV